MTGRFLDIGALFAARNNPELLGKVTAFAATLDSLARRDPRYRDVAHAANRMWAALVSGNNIEIRRAAIAVCDEADRFLKVTSTPSGPGAAP